jgi:hypothetical protein
MRFHSMRSSGLLALAIRGHERSVTIEDERLELNAPVGDECRLLG